jgi:PPOX class probable F420-dependent enzyme
MPFAVDQSTEFGKRVMDRLAHEEVAWLTTVDQRGIPRPTPVWFLWDEGTFIIFSQPNKPKLANIKRNSGMSLNLHDVNGGNIVIFTGQAQVVDRTTVSKDALHRYAAKYAQAIPRVGMDLSGFLETYSETIRFTPEKLRGW